MPRPSQLSIATQAVTRLLREEISYEKELVEQKAKVIKLENEVKEGKPDEDGNRDHMLKQLVCFLASFFHLFPSASTPTPFPHYNIYVDATIHVEPSSIPS